MTSFAQRDEQLWVDFQVDYPFQGQYLFEASASYQTIFSDNVKWRNFSITPTFEYQFFPRIDFLLNLPIAYTLQTESVNSFDFAPNIGARLRITQNRRIETRLIPKFEERFFHKLDTKDWQQSSRFRVKAEAWIAINKPNLYYDNLWYTVFDYEEFIVFDQQVDERYANRRRARVGLGYRLDYKNRFELFYARQSSRNEIEGAFVSDDNIIQLRYKLFFNPSRASASDSE